MLMAKTIGNATFLAYEKDCILVTDPWLGEEDSAYFGSWNLSHKIPKEIKDDIFAAKFIWFSHGHPDHINPMSMKRYVGKKILLPDHVGGRIKDGLNAKGYDVEIVPDRKWFSLSDNIKIFCITTSIQDAILLIALKDHLFINLNDAGTRGCTGLIRNTCRHFKNNYLLSLSGYGDADMINFYDDNGNFIEPSAAYNTNVGEDLSLLAKALGIRNVIPFSSFHNYQREDSIWASKYTTPLSAYKVGFHSDLCFIAPFAAIDCETGEIEQIQPEENKFELYSPTVFGDDWSDELNDKDRKMLTNYFRRKEKVNENISFINFKVGGKENFIKLDGENKKGITFEVPRGSLMTSIEHEIFDDVLIGNFMKTTLHNMSSLYEKDFNFYVTKYGDNGRAQTHEELEIYFAIYNKRIGSERLYEMFVAKASNLAKRLLPERKDSEMYIMAKKVYYFIK